MPQEAWTARDAKSHDGIESEGRCHHWKLKISCRFKTDRKIHNTDRKIRKLIFLSIYRQENYIYSIGFVIFLSVCR